MLLPWIEQANAWREIRFDEPYDAPRNGTATRLKLEIFLCPSDPWSAPVSYGGGNYVACFGRGDMVLAPDQGDGVFFRNSRIRLRDIEDGPITILVGERKRSPINADWASIFAGANEPQPGPSAPAVMAPDRTRVLGHTGSASGASPVHPPNATPGCAADFSSFHHGSQFLLVDGSVRFLSDQIDPGVYTALATRAAGDLANAADF